MAGPQYGFRVAIKDDVTRADLSELRASALGAANPLGAAGDLAEAVAAGRLADPQDAGYALTLAAEIAESRSKLDTALRYADQALDAYGKREDNEAGTARALRARILFRSGREDEAMAELEPLRPLLAQDADAAAYLSAALAVGGRTKLAEEWLTEAVKTAIAERGQAADPGSADEAGQLFFLLQQRHRVRHALGLPHDSHDNLADRLENKLASATTRAAETPGDLVFWPKSEFESLLAQWPGLAEVHGATWDEHRARTERRMVTLGGAGRGLHPGTVAGLQAFAGSDGDPADPKTRSSYIRSLSAGAVGAVGISWPPERNDACWCGSGSKYKKCCLPRGRA